MKGKIFDHWWMAFFFVTVSIIVGWFWRIAYEAHSIFLPFFYSANIVLLIGLKKIFDRASKDGDS